MQSYVQRLPGNRVIVTVYKGGHALRKVGPNEGLAITEALKDITYAESIGKVIRAPGL